MMKEDLLSLVRLGTSTVNDSRLTVQGSIDWPSVKELAEKQGLSAVVLDGIERLPDQQRPPKVFLLEWIGETLQGYEYRFEQYRKVIAEMAGFYNSHGYKMMLLKGYACSIDWPRPEHRPCGDIDIWLFGKQKEADAALGSWFKVQGSNLEIDKSHHHHTVFYWGEFMVENHYDFVNVNAHRSSAEMEKVFKEMGQDDSHMVEVNGEKVYLPSANLHALFLIKYMVSHFAAAEISLRQVLDWAFFAKAHTNEIDWVWLNGMIKKFHMKDFVNCINAICVENLGFEASIFGGVQFEPILKDKVLKNIMNPAFGADEPNHLIPRLIYKYRRWKGNTWKQDMCYGESRWDSFWWLLRSHLMKPVF